MPKWLAVLLVLVCLCAPHVAFARSDQDQFAAGFAEAGLVGTSLDGDILGIPKEQVAVVGAGIIAGALVLHLVVPGDLTYFTGGVVGGLAALWWYENRGEMKRPMLKLERASAVAAARSKPVLEGVAPTR